MSSPSLPKVATFAPDEVKLDERSDEAQEKRRLSRSYGKWFMGFAVLSYIGYVFTFVLRSVSDVWYQQPHYVHGWFGLLWGLLLISQVASGATTGDLRRAVHRTLGSWVAPIIFFGLMASGATIVIRGYSLAGDYYAGHVDAHDAVQGYILLHMAVFDSVAFTIAYVAAKHKEFQTHKDMIGFVVIAFGDAGTYRLIVTALHAMVPCPDEAVSKNKKVVAHVINRVLLLLVVVPIFMKYKRFNKLNSGMLALFTLLEAPVIARITADLCD